MAAKKKQVGGKVAHLPKQIAIRLPADLLVDVDALIPAIQAHRLMGMAGPWTRARVIRLLLEEGMVVAKRKYLKR